MDFLKLSKYYLIFVLCPINFISFIFLALQALLSYYFYFILINIFHKIQAMEATYTFLAMNMIVVTLISWSIDFIFSTSKFGYTFRVWSSTHMSDVAPHILSIYLFCAWNIAIIQNFCCNRGIFLWR